MYKSFFKLLFVLFLFSTSDLKAFYGTSKVPVRDRYFSIDYANYGYQLDTIVVLRNPSLGTLNVSNRSILEYTTQNYSIIDTISIALLYSNPYDTTNTTYSDTIEFYLDVLGRANTIASFYAIPGPLSAEFFNASSSDSTKLTYYWDFDDSSSSTQFNPKHQFTSAGTYNVCLTTYSSIDSNRYCESITVFDSTYIQANPDVLYYYYPDSAAYTALKDNDQYYGNASVSISRQGVFGQASISNGVLKYTVDSFVNYTYDMLEYVLNNGTVTDTGVVYIYHYLRQDYAFCQPDFNYSNSLSTVNFSNATKCAGNNSAKSYQWDFGDSTFSTQKNPVHTYSSYGTYNVCIETTDSFDVKLRTCKFIYVYDNRCQPEFGYVVGINQVSLHPFGNCPDALAYEWDFGDSSTSSEMYPVHQYASTGTYNVCLTKYGLNDTTTVCKSVTVLDTNSVVAQDDYVLQSYSLSEVELKVMVNDIVYNNASLSIIVQPSLLDARTSGNSIFIKNKRYQFTGFDQLVYSICRGGVCDTAIVYVSLEGGSGLSSCQPDINYTINGTNVTFNVLANCGSNDSLLAFYWTFSDGDTAMQKQAVHDFKRPGLHYANLTAFDTFGKAAYAFEVFCIVDSSINNGNVLAVDDEFTTNFFSLSNRYNVLYNDVNLNFKNAYTTLVKDFNHGITLFDTLGHLMWLPDSAYLGCDTLVYAVYDRSNNSVSDTAVVYICFDDLGLWCVDSTFIDTSYDCGTFSMPVCGCNGVEYLNSCEAFTKGGVGFYLNGPCSNYIPGVNLNQSSSMISMYNDEVKEMGYTVPGVEKKNLEVELVADYSNSNEDCFKLKHNKLLNSISIESCQNFTGNLKFYSTVCDQYGACNIDTFYVQVKSRFNSSFNAIKEVQINVYPNPVNDHLKIAAESVENLLYTISDITGSEILNGNFKEQVSVNLSELSQGMYILKVKNDKGDLVKVEKLIKN